MKHFFLIFLAIGFGILTYAQTQYEVSFDGTNKILKGTISRELIADDPCFSWFAQNQAGYLPDTQTVAILRSKKEKVKLTIVAGTWNESCKLALPKIFALLAKASFPQENVTLIGVDRQRSAIGVPAEDLHPSSLPTLIITDEKGECGRVTRFGNSSPWEHEIAQIVRAVN